MKVYPEQQKEIRKCVASVIPRANNAIFREIEGSEELHHLPPLIPDPNRPGDEYGHIKAHSGDSGGPLWRECKNGKAELIAIWQSNFRRDETVLYGAYSSTKSEQPYTTKCASVATKITRQMVEWLKLIENCHTLKKRNCGI